MTPDALRALADTVAWQDRTDLHGAMLGAADEIQRLDEELSAANEIVVSLCRQLGEERHARAERSRAVREDLDLAPRAGRRAPVLGAEGREIEGVGG